MNDKPVRSSLRRAITANHPAVLIVAVAVGAFVIGYGVNGMLGAPPVAAPHPAVAPAGSEGEDVIWTCSMHPEVRSPKPGQCPKCGMDLIPLEGAGDGGMEGIPELTVSAAAAALMDVQTTPVERRYVEANVRMVGKVDYDETKLATITAWVPGRVDRLYVDYTGIHVNKGDHMVSLYSPELITAQEELRRAAHAVGTIGAGAPEVLKQTAQTTLEAAKAKLSRWGLTDRQIATAQEKGAFEDHVTIYAPIGGTVIERNGVEGMYVDIGTPIYTIADLSTVWVMLEAYETDLVWLRYGQHVSFTTEAYPGEVFDGQITFIDPVLNDRTRTVDVRVSVPNSEGKLKPDMFVRGVVRTQVAKGGRVMDPDLVGKWVSPMHPEIVKNGPGQCDICGMDLVPAEELGYVSAGAADSAAPLVIPVTAPLITGKRAVVYVAVPDAPEPTFVGREVVLGPRAGDYYIVESGLEEGERVVTSGNFKIDSALQIQAKPSMMSPAVAVAPPPAAPPGETPPPMKFAAPEEFQTQLGALFDAYLSIGRALAADDADAAREDVPAAREALAAIDMTLVEGAAHEAWMTSMQMIEAAVDRMAAAEEVDALRVAFEPFSESVRAAIETFGLAPERPVYVVHCPMAFDNRGADWLQVSQDVRNPYFGSMMLKCGDVVREITRADAHAHE